MHSTEHQGVILTFSPFWTYRWALGAQYCGTKQILGFEVKKGPTMTQNDPKKAPKWPKSVEKALKAKHCELEAPEK